MVMNRLSFTKRFFSCRWCSRRKCTQTLRYWLLVGERVWFRPICRLWIRLLENSICSENSGVKGIFPHCDKKSPENFSCQLCGNGEKSKQDKTATRWSTQMSSLRTGPITESAVVSNVCADKPLQSCPLVTFILFTLLLWEPAASTSIRLH